MNFLWGTDRKTKCFMHSYSQNMDLELGFYVWYIDISLVICANNIMKFLQTCLLASVLASEEYFVFPIVRARS